MKSHLVPEVYATICIASYVSEQEKIIGFFGKVNQTEVEAKMISMFI